MWPLVEAGKIKPVIDSTPSADQGVGRTCPHWKAARIIGEIVLTI